MQVTFDRSDDNHAGCLYFLPRTDMLNFPAYVVEDAIRSAPVLFYKQGETQKRHCCGREKSRFL